MILCDDQAEVDRYWDAFIADGGTESACGWLKDRWGVSWQITPVRLMELNNDPVHGPRAMAAMMTMHRIDIAALEHAIAS
jgi:predicted 3-demethylubiquinone-9 3-methyltransferase (glyoxalase superfamily)